MKNIYIYQRTNGKLLPWDQLHPLEMKYEEQGFEINCARLIFVKQGMMNLLMTMFTTSTDKWFEIKRVSDDAALITILSGSHVHGRGLETLEKFQTRADKFINVRKPCSIPTGKMKLLVEVLRKLVTKEKGFLIYH